MYLPPYLSLATHLLPGPPSFENFEGFQAKGAGLLSVLDSTTTCLTAGVAIWIRALPLSPSHTPLSPSQTDAATGAKISKQKSVYIPAQ